MKIALRIAIITTLVMVLAVQVVMAQGQLRAKFTILDTKTKEPIAGVKCVAYQPDRPNNKWNKESDESGEFAIAGLEPGVIVFELTKDGYQSARFNRRMRTSSPRIAFTVEIIPLEREVGQATPEIVEKYNQGMQLANQQDHEGALSIFNELIAEYPDIKESYLAASTELNALGRYQESIQMLEPLLADNPENTDLMLRLAENYVSMGESEKATQWYEKIIAMDPTDLYAIEKVAMANYVGNNFDEAVKYYNMALELKPDNAIAHYYIASIYYATDDLKNAIEHFERYIELDPENSTGGFDAAHGAVQDMVNTLAKRHYDAGEFDDAFAYANKALGIDPDNAKAHYYLGGVYYSKEDFANALKHFEKCVELDQGKGEEAELAKAAIEEINNR